MSSAVEPLRITIDARFLGPRLSGLGRYVSKLVEELQRIDDRNRYTVLLSRSNWSDFVPARSNFQRALADVGWYTFGEQLRMPGILSRTRPDLVHFPNFNFPLVYRGPFVATIHDLIKSQFGPAQAAASESPVVLLKHQVYKRTIAAAVTRARLILVPSAAVRTELVKSLGVREDNIIVTPEAAEAVFLDQTSTQQDHDVLERYGIREPFVLYVGNAYPYKNVESVIDALTHISEPLFLVNPCSRDAFYPRLRRRAKERQVEDRLILPGFVPDQDLAVLFRRARVYVFPSLAEGFGIPALEAMASGLPVACSDIPVLHETCGDAAMYFSPRDPAGIAAAVNQLLSDDGLRAELVRAGKARAAVFSWRRTAELTLAAYQRAASPEGAARG
ncbi:MAG TPA: glycosyltransferase family 1 protein [Candidatus Dormibacteraeota bacterium]